MGKSALVATLALSFVKPSAHGRLVAYVSLPELLGAMSVLAILVLATALCEGTADARFAEVGHFFQLIHAVCKSTAIAILTLPFLVEVAHLCFLHLPCKRSSGVI